MLTDTDAVYCGAYDGGNLTWVASDGSVSVLATTGRVGALALDADDVYWTETGASGAIKAVAKTGGAPRVVVPVADPTALAVDATNVYWGSFAGIWRTAK